MEQEITFEQYLNNVQDILREYPQLRLGQAFYNGLYGVKPALAFLLLGTDRDPFYADDRCPEFLEFVEENWPRMQ